MRSMHEEGCADGKDDRHCAHHQRGVRDGGESEAGELDEELERDSQEGCEQKEAPVGPAEAWPVRQKQGRERERREEEAVEDHGADIHLDEGDLAEEEAAAPERAGESAACEAESAGFVGLHSVLPDAAAIGGNHRLAGLAAEGGSEAGLVDDDSVDAEAVWGVGVLQHLLADGLWADVLAPVLGEADVEALRR